MGGSQTRSGCLGENKRLLRLPGIKPRFLSFQARSMVTLHTELTRLQFSVYLTTLPVNWCVYCLPITAGS